MARALGVQSRENWQVITVRHSEHVEPSRRMQSHIHVKKMSHRFRMAFCRRLALTGWSPRARGRVLSSSYRALCTLWQRTATAQQVSVNDDSKATNYFVAATFLLRLLLLLPCHVHRPSSLCRSVLLYLLVLYAVLFKCSVLCAVFHHDVPNRFIPSWCAQKTQAQKQSV